MPQTQGDDMQATTNNGYRAYRVILAYSGMRAAPLRIIAKTSREAGQKAVAAYGSPRVSIVSIEEEATPPHQGA